MNVVYIELEQFQIKRNLFNLQQLFSSTSFLYIHFQATVKKVSEDWRQLLWVLELRCAVCGNQI